MKTGLASNIFQCSKHFMTLVQTILAIILATVFIAWILFIIFGQVAMRKLRNNLETKHEPGIEFVRIARTITADCHLQSPYRKSLNDPVSNQNSTIIVRAILSGWDIFNVAQALSLPTVLEKN